MLSAFGLQRAVSVYSTSKTHGIKIAIDIYKKIDDPIFYHKTITP